jgi:hypothetical protein
MHKTADMKQHSENMSHPPEDELTHRTINMIEYFPTDIRLIKELESLPNPSQPLSEIQKRHILELKTKVLLEYEKIMVKGKAQDLIFDRSNFFFNFLPSLAIGVLLNLSPLGNEAPSVAGTFLFFLWICESAILPLINHDRGERLGDFLSGEWILAKPFPAPPPVSENTSSHQQ